MKEAFRNLSLSHTQWINPKLWKILSKDYYFFYQCCVIKNQTHDPHKKSFKSTKTNTSPSVIIIALYIHHLFFLVVFFFFDWQDKLSPLTFYRNVHRLNYLFNKISKRLHMLKCKKKIQSYRQQDIEDGICQSINSNYFAG